MYTRGEHPHNVSSLGRETERSVKVFSYALTSSLLLV